METHNAAERRHHPRFGLKFDVQMQKLDAAEDDPRPMSHLGMSRDISESGIRVWASCAYPIQSRLLLTFECPEMGWNKITSRVGQVVWAEDLRADGEYLLGIRFADGEPAGQPRAA